MEVKLPKGWHEVNVDTFLKYNTILTSKAVDPLDLEVNIISCFSGLSVKEVESLKTKQILKLAKSLEFLKKLPDTKVALSFKCKGKTYKACLLMEDLTGGQFMDFSNILKGTKPEDYVYRMTDLIGAMCIEREFGLFYDKGRVSIYRYKYQGYAANSEVFKDLPISIAYPYYVFFCKVMGASFPYIQDYLSKKLLKLTKKMNRDKKDSASTGATTP